MFLTCIHIFKVAGHIWTSGGWEAEKHPAACQSVVLSREKHLIGILHTEFQPYDRMWERRGKNHMSQNNTSPVFFPLCFSSDRHIMKMESTSSDRGPEETPSSSSVKERWAQCLWPTTQNIRERRALGHIEKRQLSLKKSGSSFGWRLAAIHHLGLRWKERQKRHLFHHPLRQHWEHPERWMEAFSFHLF